MQKPRFCYEASQPRPHSQYMLRLSRGRNHLLVCSFSFNLLIYSFWKGLVSCRNIFKTFYWDEVQKTYTSNMQFGCIFTSCMYFKKVINIAAQGSLLVAPVNTTLRVASVPVSSSLLTFPAFNNHVGAIWKAPSLGMAPFAFFILCEILACPCMCLWVIHSYCC